MPLVAAKGAEVQSHAMNVDFRNGSIATVGRLQVTSGLPRTTDIARPPRQVRVASALTSCTVPGCYGNFEKPASISASVLALERLSEPFTSSHGVRLHGNRRAVRMGPVSTWPHFLSGPR
jgi:hypothetical protein